MTPGQFYAESTLVRVVGPGFVAGMLLDPVTDCVVFTAPLLRYLTGQPRAKLRRTFARLGWKATIVARKQGGPPSRANEDGGPDQRRGRQEEAPPDRAVAC